MGKKGILIGIAGASGSGKTLVAQNLYQTLGSDKVIIIQEDAYYKDLSHLSFEERTRVNYDHPEAFDHALLVEHMDRLLQGERIQHPIYDYTTHSRKKEFREVGPHEIIICEGILLLSIPELRDLMDIKIYIDTPQDICFIRRLQRDIHERGRSVDSVIAQYMKTVRPMFMQFVEPSKRFADIIIPRGGKNSIAIDILKSKIEELLSGRN